MHFHTHLVHQFAGMKTQAVEEDFLAEQMHFFDGGQQCGRAIANNATESEGHFRLQNRLIQFSSLRFFRKIWIQIKVFIQMITCKLKTITPLPVSISFPLLFKSFFVHWYL